MEDDHQLNGTSVKPQDTLDRVLQVSFKWAKNTVSITEPGHDEPIYLGKLNPWTLKTVYRICNTGTNTNTNAKVQPGVPSSTAGESSVIGEGNIGYFKIDCQTEVRGRPIRLSAAKKLFTIYNYPSLAYASDSNKPAVMTWKSNSTFKVFDFDLFDENEQLVARFNPRYLGIRKVATIELFGPKAWETAAVEEVLITGLTLYICMIYRSSSIVSLVGALVGRPGKDYKVTEKQAKEDEERQLKQEEDQYNAMSDDQKAAHADDVWKELERKSTMDKEEMAR